MASSTTPSTKPEPPKEEPKDEPEEKPSKVTLEDLNNDPTLAYTLTPKQAGALVEQSGSDDTEGSLPFNILSLLHRISLEDDKPASKEDQENAAAAAAAGFGQG